MSRRARGANATLALAVEDEYGEAPTSGFRKLSFVSVSLGAEQGLNDGELLGGGREPGEPGQDALNNAGDAVVPICSRQFGTILMGALGEPTTTAGKAATGHIKFSANPANNATISVGGQTFTFTSSTPSGNQIAIGAKRAITVANAVRALNASTVAGVAAATYRANDKGDTILIQHDTLGTAGNSLALEASTSPASNATVSGATLSGGAAGGGYRHVFTSGAQELPSFSAEVGFPDVPAFNMNTGVKIGGLAIQLQRGGNLTARVDLIAQAESITEDSAAGTVLDELELSRLHHASASVRRNGVPIGDLVGGQFNLSNGLDPVPAIRSDSCISGIDEGGLTVTGQISIRYSTSELQKQAERNEPCELEFVWSHPGNGHSLRLIIHRVFLPPRAKRPVTGPGGILADYTFQAAKDPGLGRALTAVLDNDVSAYA